MSHNFAAKLNQIDVINPPILKIDGRNYRNLQLSQATPCIHGTSYYTETDSTCYEDECSDIYELPDGSYQLSLTIPKFYHHRIIGHMGSTLKKLENDTGCAIEIPKFQSDSEVVIVKGNTQRGIQSVKNRIEIILESILESSEVTHFISIPMSSPGITAALREFKHRILGASARGIEESIFQDPAKLHITVCALKLHSKEDILRAHTIFSNRIPALIESCFDNGLVSIELKGANCMNDDSSDVHVVYADVEVVGRKDALQIFADQVENIFDEEGLAETRKGRVGVKLHVTLMNSKKRTTRTTGTKRTPRVSFDARYVLGEYSNDHVFGSVPLSQIHLSILKSVDPNTGYYQQLQTVHV